MATKQTISSLTLPSTKIEVISLTDKTMVKDGKTIEWKEVKFLFDGDLLTGSTNKNSNVKEGKCQANFEIANGGSGLKFKLHFIDSTTA
ncbi:MAG: hypothetical protein ACPGJV_10350 [Bacteriovoracaceae bacterium]